MSMYFHYCFIITRYIVLVPVCIYRYIGVVNFPILFIELVMLTVNSQLHRNNLCELIDLWHKYV